MIVSRLLLPLFLFFFASPLAAQGRINAIQPELAAEAPPAADGSVELALVMHVQKGWHGYWLNPGDAGFPLRAQWSLSDGASVEPLRFPVPQRLLVAGLVNYVYESDYALLTRLKLPPGVRQGTIQAELNWLACTDKICVPEKGEVMLDLAGIAGRDSRFDNWRRLMPHPIASPAHFALEGGKVRVAVPLPASVTLGEPYFFPGERAGVDLAAPQHFRRQGDVLIADLAAEGASPTSVSGVLALGDGRGIEIAATPGPVPSGGSAVGSLGVKAIIFAVLGAILGGMLLNLMPCVFPILALKALHLARAGEGEPAARRDALAYAAGAIVGTGVLGAVLLTIRAGGTAAGWAFQLQDPRTTILLMLLATALTLNLLRTFELPVLAGEAAPAGSFGTGALAAFVATPCAGPFLGAALGTALLLPAAGSVAVFAALGLGLALPFVVVAFVPALRQWVPKPGPWMARLQRFLAIPMAAVAVGCLWLLDRQAGTPALIVGLGAAAVLAALLAWLGWRQRGGRHGGLAALGAGAVIIFAAAALVPQRPETVSRVPLGASAWSEAAVARAQADGRPVFVYFTADWCLTCKVNEAGAIDRDAVRDAFGKANVKIFVADWTNGDPAITRFLDRRSRAAVPLYLWYPAGGGEPEELPQILTPGLLISKAR